VEGLNSVLTPVVQASPGLMIRGLPPDSLAPFLLDRVKNAE